MQRRPSDSASPESADGLASLQIAQAHLEILLTANENLDGKAGILTAVNIAFYAVLFGALLAAEERSWWVAAAPSLLMIGVLTQGWRTMRPRRLRQFPSPRQLLQFQASGRTDHELAWIYLRSIATASTSVTEIVRHKHVGVAVLAGMTLLHLIAIAVSTVLWFF